MHPPDELTPGMLRRFEVFEALNHEALAYLTDLIDLRCFETDETVVREGERSREMYLLSGGKVGVFKSFEGGETSHDGELDTDKNRRLTTLESPTVFGELGFILGEPRTATVRADCFSNICAIDGALVEQLRADRPDIAYELVVGILRLVATRQTDTNRELLKWMDRATQQEDSDSDDSLDVGEQLMRRWTL